MKTVTQYVQQPITADSMWTTDNSKNIHAKSDFAKPAIDRVGREAIMQSKHGMNSMMPATDHMTFLMELLEPDEVRPG